MCLCVSVSVSVSPSFCRSSLLSPVFFASLSFRSSVFLSLFLRHTACLLCLLCLNVYSVFVVSLSLPISLSVSLCFCLFSMPSLYLFSLFYLSAFLALVHYIIIIIRCKTELQPMENYINFGPGQGDFQHHKSANSMVIATFHKENDGKSPRS